MFSDFVTCAMDLIVNQAAKMRFMLGGQVKIPIVFRTPAGSGTGAAAQHSQSLEAWFAHVPGLKVVMPATPYDAKGLLKAAIRDDNPVMFYEHKIGYSVKGEVPDDEEIIVPIGKADIKRKGKDLTIISYSYTLIKCLEAAKKLEQQGIDAEVLDLRTIYPLDADLIIQSVKKTGKALIVHESVQKFGIGAEIAAVIADSEAFFHLDRPIFRLGGGDLPIPYSPELEAQIVPQVDTIISAAVQLLK
jgi:pyruvate dehydrogenase E1 component beta subunit